MVSPTNSCGCTWEVNSGVGNVMTKTSSPKQDKLLRRSERWKRGVRIRLVLGHKSPVRLTTDSFLKKIRGCFASKNGNGIVTTERFHQNRGTVKDPEVCLCIYIYVYIYLYLYLFYFYIVFCIWCCVTVYIWFSVAILISSTITCIVHSVFHLGST